MSDIVFELDTQAVFEQLGYSRKDALNRKLARDCREGFDYIRQAGKGSTYSILITQECFDNLNELHQAKVCRAKTGKSALAFTSESATALFESTDPYPVDFELAWQWAGYSRKDSAKDTLLANFTEGEDYVMNTDSHFNPVPTGTRGSYIFISLSLDCFKHLAMMAQTVVGRAIRQYFIEIEKAFRVRYQESLLPTTTVVPPLPPAPEPSIPRPIKKQITEKIIQEELILLATRVNKRYQREYIVKDTITGTAKSRRFDLVEETASHINIIELKLGLITTSIISETIADRGYLDLAEDHPSFGKPVKLVFVSPAGIDNIAERMIKRIPGVRFIHLHELAYDLLQEAAAKIRKEVPSQVRWYLEQHYLPECKAIYPFQVERLLGTPFKLVTLQEACQVPTLEAVLC